MIYVLYRLLSVFFPGLVSSCLLSWPCLLLSSFLALSPPVFFPGRVSSCLLSWPCLLFLASSLRILSVFFPYSWPCLLFLASSLRILFVFLALSPIPGLVSPYSLGILSVFLASSLRILSVFFPYSWPRLSVFSPYSSRIPGLVSYSWPRLSVFFSYSWPCRAKDSVSSCGYHCFSLRYWHTCCGFSDLYRGKGLSVNLVDRAPPRERVLQNAPKRLVKITGWFVEAPLALGGDIVTCCNSDS